MIIIGIDPGSIKTGYGVVQWQNKQLKYLTSGTIAMQSSTNINDRLHTIYQSLMTINRQYQPEQMAIEDVFVVKNPKSALILGHARGAAIIAGREFGLPIFNYSAKQVKRAIVGYGNASKDQVQFMVAKLLGIPNQLQTDAADALAIACCHAFHLVPN